MKLPILLLVIIVQSSLGVRLHKLFEFLEGHRADHSLQGFLHVGDKYSVYLRKPNQHDKNLVYELYETKNVPDVENVKPKLLAVSIIPVKYIKEQMTTFKGELYASKYVDLNVVPGTKVLTMREWQIDQALKQNDGNGVALDDSPSVLRSSS